MGSQVASFEAARADAVLTQRFGFDPGTLLVVYEDPLGQLLATDPRFQADVEVSVAGLRSLPEVADVISPALNPRQLAPDGHAAYVVVTLHVVPADPHPLLNTVTQALRATELRPTLTGQPVFLQDIFDVTENDLRRAELISFPFAAVAHLLKGDAASLARRLRFRTVDDDARDPPLERRTRFEAIETAHYSQPGILHDLLGDRDVPHEHAGQAEHASVIAID
jgi:hypothetical protein